MRQYYALQSDNRFSANPLVTGEAGIRFYAGIPLCTPSAQNIGTLCVIDTKPRDLSGAEIDMLRDLAGLVVDELELRQIATTDSLTGLGTRRCPNSDGAMEIARARRYERSLGRVALDIDYFKSINDRYGHAAGDAVLQAVAKLCMSGLRSVDTSYRLGGEELVFLMPETDGEMARAAAEELRRLVMETPIKFDGVDIAVTASFGVAELSPQYNDLSEMLKRADEALYEAKGAGRDCTVWIDREGEHILKDAEQIKLVV